MNSTDIFTTFIENSAAYLAMAEEDRENLKQFFRDIPYLHIQNLGNHLVDGLFVCDQEGTILYVNKANENLVGIRAAECVGKNISSFLQKDGISNVVARNVIETKSVYSSLAVSPKTNIQLLETGSPIYNERGEFIGVVIIDRNISELTTVTDQLKLTEEKIASFQKITEKNALVMNQLTQQHILEQMRFSENVQPKSPAMRKVYTLAYQVAKTDVTVLLTGETGTGKEVIANYIYTNSSRSSKPFIKVNCAAIPEHLLESELFGYVKGAFTGADPHGKIGMFELANTGTLFLDEIGELPMDFQAKLLRALQQQEITRLGDTKTIKLDIRIIAATNRDLLEMTEKGTFRSDLYYRLNIFPIPIPALRERTEDIPLLIDHFLRVFNKKYNKNILIDTPVLQRMSSYAWPGNIRELENLIERWIVIFEDYTTITWKTVSSYFPSDSFIDPFAEYDGKSLNELMKSKEADILRWAIGKYGTSREAAKALGVDHSTIVRKANAYGLMLKKRSGQSSQPDRKY